MIAGGGAGDVVDGGRYVGGGFVAAAAPPLRGPRQQPAGHRPEPGRRPSWQRRQRCRRCQSRARLSDVRARRFGRCKVVGNVGASGGSSRAVSQRRASVGRFAVPVPAGQPGGTPRVVGPQALQPGRAFRPSSRRSSRTDRPTDTGERPALGALDVHRAQRHQPFAGHQGQRIEAGRRNGRGQSGEDVDHSSGVRASVAAPRPSTVVR